jgi:asparagine synthase (glutamine-hydrolysing)
MQFGGGRFTLVFNGAIYNFRDIRHELIQAGEQFNSESDTEVILAACARWGPDALNRFNGMWALCFYDAQSKSGFIARDRFGVKPLLYATSGAGLSFASEMPALTLLGVDRSIDHSSLAHHLVFGYMPHPRTIYVGAKRLSPGHYLPFGSRAAELPIRYYDPIAARGGGTVDYEEARRELRTRISSAVTARLVSDVPLGAFLSGGLDSSIIVKHAAEATPGRVATFAVGYEGQRNYDERRFARLAARHFDTDHHEIVVTQREAIDTIPKVLDHLGEPFGDSSIVPTSLVSKFAAGSFKVALSGDGGDELFAGYWRYSAHTALETYLRLPSALRTLFIEPVLLRLGVSKSGAVSNRLRQFRKLLRANGQDAIARHAAWSRILAPEAEDVLRDCPMCLATIREYDLAARRLTEGMSLQDGLSRILAFDLQYQLPGDMLHKVDLASMMHSLEVRVPFLDPGVVEFATGLPMEFKLHRGQRKRILLDAYRGHVPDEILDRPKQGFELPIGEFLRGPLRALFHGVVDRKTIESIGFISYPAVERVFQDHLSRRAEHADLLFSLLSLCWWRRHKESSP